MAAPAASCSAAVKAPVATTSKGGKKRTLQAASETVDTASEKPAAVTWSKNAEEYILEAWGEEYLRIKKGNLSNAHWKRISTT
jgi:hypothetical protein